MGNLHSVLNKIGLVSDFPGNIFADANKNKGENYKKYDVYKFCQ